jgi:UDP-N-acetylmuramoylalanine--D-glutamate ligase
MARLANNPQDQQILYPGIKVLVVGLGQTGVAAVKFFKNFGAMVSVSESTPKFKIDRNTLEMLKENGISLEAGGHTVDSFQSADLIFVSPGVPLDLQPLAIARSLSIPVIGELAIVAQYLKTPVVAVTGTNGKTTVTTLLGDIFKACGKKVFIGGNIGTPLFDYLAGPQEADIVVAEISSFQLDTGGNANGLHPAVALLLNITPDHLERYASFEAYAEAKFKIFAAQDNGDFAILNADDINIMARQELWPSSRKYFFGKNLHGHPGVSIDGKIVRISAVDQASDTLLLPDESYDLAGTLLENSPNLQNAAAAILAARLLGCSASCIKKGLDIFSPLEHRMSLLTEINGVKYYDDSKATNVGAVQSALASLQGPIILIAGGRDKGGEYSVLNDLVQQKVKNLLLIGEAKEKMARALAPFTHVEVLTTLSEAVSRASIIAVPGDTVLLSPACSSFDMFESYAARGDYFKKSVFELKAAMKIETDRTVIQ